MKLIPPITITDVEFHDSTITEPSVDELADVNYRGEWNAGVTYTVNALVIVVADHKRYISLQNGNVGYTPGGAGNEAWWSDDGYTDRWKVFDAVVGSQATLTSAITYELDPGPIDSVALLNIEAGTTTVTMTDVGGAGDPIIWTETTKVDGMLVSDVAYTDFPLTYLTPHIVIELSIPATGDSVKIGEIIVGQKESLGNTKYIPSVGITDYSIKEVDDFGNYTVLERAYSKRLSCATNILNTQLDAVYNVLASYRAQPVVWIGHEDYASMIVYGFYKDFSIEIAYLKYSVCTLEIEGLV